MPNWALNTIKVEKPNVLKQYIYIEDGHEVFDFNKLKPMPEELNIESSSLTGPAIYYYLKEVYGKEPLRNLFYCFSDKINDYEFAKTYDYKNMGISFDKLYELGKQYCYNYKHFGSNSWYEWTYENWGTKWNSCDNYVDPDCYYCDFSTAWCAPIPIFEQMCKENPNAFIEFYSDYEEGFCEKHFNYNGELKLEYHKENSEDE